MSIDIYREWLGIDTAEHPPNCYQLLGLALFENNIDRICEAADSRIKQVRQLARGDFTEIGQDLLNELADAKLRLISETSREAYNQTLAPDSASAEEEIEPREFGTIEEVESALNRATFVNILSSQPGEPTKHRWLIGANRGCDFQIDCPTISGVHCEVRFSRKGLFIADLNSTNGTYINCKPIKERHAVSKVDLVTLGKDQRILLPGNLMLRNMANPYAAVFVGKGAANEIRLESKAVSLFHARVMLVDQSIYLEDLKSSNGTYLQRDRNAPVRIQRCKLQSDDLIRFADTELPASTFFKIRDLYTSQSLNNS